ncbi:PHP domain-containing protein [Oscillatoria sp. CS-180]|uniref:PHP domain-containing protein n=1 Tax=Oscillatoria sp. CS-180 TaxID=3021720 RepID=UPI00232EA986|nr:PHP domain-containing protein [Oscillatoria sp. CS-180]MDB9526213.1 PHP domain-containing protein [Oscillatoria sp. CS-180]
MLELHCHTTCSDGTLTPKELVESAIAAGVKAMAITDHDTLAGWEQAIEAAGDQIEIIPGLELSTVHRERSLHILGYYPNRAQLENPLKARIEGRKRRAQAMANKLAELGYPIQLPAMPGDMAPCRPHIAKALVKAGYITHAQEAFTRWIGDGGPAYVQYEKFSAEDGIQLLLDCGAVPVWAHPYLFRGGTVESVLPELMEAGLMGIEVYHPNHSPSDERKLEELCTQHDLLMTGGSDYHGPSEDKSKAATGLNGLKVPLSLLTPLKQAAIALKQ